MPIEQYIFFISLIKIYSVQTFAFLAKQCVMYSHFSETTRINLQRVGKTIDIPVVYMVRDVMILKSQDFQGPSLSMARVVDLPPSKSLCPSTLKKIH